MPLEIIYLVAQIFSYLYVHLVLADLQNDVIFISKETVSLIFSGILGNTAYQPSIC